ncbi:exopolysaccharide biosynthesis polyprenyl glycosylphosphotransferase [Leptotrichia sp. OH3620_COT-345]|uniref:exopolysaccharide biosynthesis polyprenyl glycosylphosphotransferase n=1 Tax=Leptotrichia sp. OH3620_COT-345 TaxID=2491048 RepID=UPI000F64A7AC|nr:exopolysaccharide biosynthesis polyprenyl glycosylphosphotransferase [Leptotrichia sp. OH3620_COT-345]RRD40743.1 exopolysaccharide biosynthesis polyprenyl glycosylphosphotransferase [Leptotrichia sp. OH3620_COT-345]
MKTNKNNIIWVIYILISYILYNFLLQKFNYPTKYLTNFLFLLFIFIKFIFGQLDFYAERFRLKDIFVNFGINFLFSIFIFIFLKRISIFGIFGIIFIFQTVFRRIVCLKYVKKERVLIFGSNHIENNVQDVLMNSPDYKYVGYISNNKSRATKYLQGKYDEMEKIIQDKEIDTLVIVKNIKNDDFKIYLKRLFDLKINGLKVLSYEEFNESIQKKIDINQIDEEWLLESNGFDILNNESQKNVKRGLDLIIAFILIILLSPVALITAFIIKLESPGPVIFKQTRIGENGKKFKIYKFRSMKLHDGTKYPKYTLDNDNRVTKFGSFMRKTRIDELPQLYCIIKGTMSFVGPRPEWDLLVEEYKKKIPYYNLRHMIKPGITGWAQVMYPYGESTEDAKRKLEYDLYYLKHQDLIMDVLTIMKTAKTVIFGKGK